jgi:hypothetical protein
MTSRLSRILLAILAFAAMAATSAAPASASGPSVTKTATQHGLTVTLTAAPANAKVGQPVHFTAKAQTEHATGAWIYSLAFGDGTTSRPVAIPQYCLAGAGRPATGSWTFTHHYRSSAHYVIRFGAAVNCSGASASVRVVVNVSR